jgi:hypothetical protein
MADFSPVSAAIGGALIGLAATLLMLLTGRIAGISGIFAGCLVFSIDDKGWRIAFIAGLLLDLPAAVLQRKTIVYVRQSTPQQVQSNLESQKRQCELVEVARRRGFANVEGIHDDLGRRAAPSSVQVSIGWSVRCAPARSAPCSASVPRGSPATAATGIICWSGADWWKPASSTLTAFATRAGLTTVGRLRPPHRRLRRTLDRECASATPRAR